MDFHLKSVEGHMERSLFDVYMTSITIFIKIKQPFAWHISFLVRHLRRYSDHECTLKIGIMQRLGAIHKWRQILRGVSKNLTLLNKISKGDPHLQILRVLNWFQKISVHFYLEKIDKKVYFWQNFLKKLTFARWKYMLSWSIFYN